MDVCVYGKGDPRQVLYLRTSQVVVFLHLSSNIVPFRNTAPVPRSQAAQTHSIAQNPTMALRPVEDILRQGFNGTKPRLLQTACFSRDVLWGVDTFSSLDLVPKHNMARKKSGSRPSFYADVRDSFSARFDRSPLDSLQFLHSPSSNGSQKLAIAATESQSKVKNETEGPL